MDTLYVSTQKTFWDSLPIWLSAIGTIGAVITSLYFSFKRDRAKGKLLIRKNYPRYDPDDYNVIVEVVNLLPSTIWIKGFGYEYYIFGGKGGLLKKERIEFTIVSQNLSDTTKLPKELKDGECVEYELSQRYFQSNHIQPTKRSFRRFKIFSIYSLRYYFIISKGKRFYCRLPKELREYYKNNHED
jgi:hypothetical protein